MPGEANKFGDANKGDLKLLPDASDAAGRVERATDEALARAAAAPQPADAPAADVERLVGAAPARQLGELPRDELNTLAEEFGLDPTQHKQQQDLVRAIHDRRQLIASLDREALIDVVRWGRRPVAFNATKEQLAQEISRIRSMRFAGLSANGLVALARLRGCECGDAEPVPDLIKKLKKQEGFFAKLNRKRRTVIASLVANIVGEADATQEYQFLPGPDGRAGSKVAGPQAPSIKHEIEEAGLFGGISNRIKKTADSYINQKLDEIEQRIDRKLDEIDRRLAEWRDKEVANRIKILKITLWASVIVGIVSLIYSYVQVNFYQPRKPDRPVPRAAPLTQPV